MTGLDQVLAVQHIAEAHVVECITLLRAAAQSSPISIGDADRIYQGALAVSMAASAAVTAIRTGGEQ